MSRSLKKSTYSAICLFKARSMRNSKAINRRQVRRIAKERIRGAEDFDALILPVRLDETMDRWEYPDDGRKWFSLRELIADGFYDHKTMSK